MPRGWLFITRGSQPGTASRIRTGHEFGLDPDPAPAAEAWARLGGPHEVGVRAESLDQCGVQTSTDNFLYHGVTYPQGRRIRSEVGFLLLDLDYRYAWPLAESLILRLHAGASYWGFSSRLRTADLQAPLDESRRFSSGLWLSGAELSESLGELWEVHGSLLGGVNGTDRFSLEVRLGLGLRVWDSLSLGIDYRYRQIRFHTSTNEADLGYQGPSAGIEIRF